MSHQHPMDGPPKNLPSHNSERSSLEGPPL